MPIFETSRGDTVESVHYGAVAVVDVYGRLTAWYGNPDSVAFLRSSAKPFQLLPFVERGGLETYGLSPQETAIMAASHSGTDEHIAVVRTIQMKTGVAEAELMCGVHPPSHGPTLEAMRTRGEQPTPNHNNCSGKHTGMLAYARMLVGESARNREYLDPDHPVQLEILETFAGMCGLPREAVFVGIDGCSAPNFAVPLRNAALAFARLCDPLAGNVQPAERAAACSTITAAMMAHPDMVAGPGRFDTQLMEVCAGKVVSKGGAEGYQALGLMPGALGPGSPAIGVAIKISDGDLTGRARPAVSLEVLRQLGAVQEAQLGLLAAFGPTYRLKNWRQIEVGQVRPSFVLEQA